MRRNQDSGLFFLRFDLVGSEEVFGSDVEAGKDLVESVPLLGINDQLVCVKVEVYSFVILPNLGGQLQQLVEVGNLLALEFEF